VQSFDANYKKCIDSHFVFLMEFIQLATSIKNILYVPTGIRCHEGQIISKHLGVQPRDGAGHGRQRAGGEGHPAAQVHVALLRARVGSSGEVVQPCTCDRGRAEGGP